jgi:hypothetical protein
MRALLLVVLCAGCAHANISASSGSPSPAAAGSAQVTTSGGVLAVAILAGVVASTASEDWRQPGGFWNRPPPALAPDREVTEQDCTKPIKFSGNLRCR